MPGAGFRKHRIATLPAIVEKIDTNDEFGSGETTPPREKPTLYLKHTGTLFG